jgi:hypothetical protein
MREETKVTNLRLRELIGHFSYCFSPAQNKEKNEMSDTPEAPETAEEVVEESEVETETITEEETLEETE